MNAEISIEQNVINLLMINLNLIMLIFIRHLWELYYFQICLSI